MINMTPIMELVKETCGHAIDKYIALTNATPIPGCHCWNPGRDKHQLDCSASHHQASLRRAAIHYATRDRA